SICARMLETYEGEEYKETFGAAIDQLRPIRSAAQIQLLDEQLLDDLRNRCLDTMHLAPPEITDWMDHDGFLLSTDPRTNTLNRIRASAPTLTPYATPRISTSRS